MRRLRIARHDCRPSLVEVAVGLTSFPRSISFALLAKRVSIMATTSTASFYAVTDQSLIASYNRGPITSLFVPPASCTATLTFAFNTLYFGHMAGYFDKDCYPTGFGGSQAPIYGSAWDAYYCTRRIAFYAHTVSRY